MGKTTMEHDKNKLQINIGKLVTNFSEKHSIDLINLDISRECELHPDGYNSYEYNIRVDTGDHLKGCKVNVISKEQEELSLLIHAKSLVTYEPISGQFIWNKREVVIDRDMTWNNKNAGKVIQPRLDGYVRFGFKINDKLKHMYAHRLAWFIVYNEVPEGLIDHINRVKDDNRISNLRLVSHADNNKNLGMSRKNKSGVTGVSFYKRYGTWQAHCSVNSIGKSLGYYSTIEEATEVVKKYRKDNGFSATHGE